MEHEGLFLLGLAAEIRQEVDKPLYYQGTPPHILLRRHCPSDFVPVPWYFSALAQRFEVSFRHQPILSSLFKVPWF